MPLSTSCESRTESVPLSCDAHRHSAIHSQHLAGDEIVAHHLKRRLSDRLDGTFASQRDAVGKVVRLGGVGHGGVKAGPDDARGENVDADVLGGVVEGKRARQRE